MSSRDEEILIPLYEIAVRPHGKYCTQFWSSCFKKIEMKPEQVQERFTRISREVKNVSCKRKLGGVGFGLTVKFSMT